MPYDRHLKQHTGYEKMKHLTNALVLIGCGSLSGLASALSPAIPENIVCATPQIFVGKILSANSTDCRLNHPHGGCSPTDKVEVVVHVERIVRSSPVPTWASGYVLKEGENTEVSIWMYSSGHNKYPPFLEEQEKVITNEIAANLLKGKTFVFSVAGPGSGPVVYSGTATPPASQPVLD